MAEISTLDARGMYTKKLIAVYKERSKAPTQFLYSFFREEFSDTKELSIEVQRGTEKIAVDVARGTKGNRNGFSKSTEKIFVPPYFREYFDATELDIYDRLFTSETIDENVLAKFLEDVADKLRALTDKIKRTYELYCAMIFQTGILELEQGTNINFLRQAISMVDLDVAGDYWSVPNHDLYVDLETGIKFVKTYGKATGSIFVGIFGAKAFSTMLKNSVFLQRQDLVSMSLDAIKTPQANSVGGVYHGRLTVGPYLLDVWTYPEQYVDPKTNTRKDYIDEDNVIITPPKSDFVFGYAAVPRLYKGAVGRIKGDFIIGEYMDEEEVSHKFDVKSAGMPIPVAIDTIWTAKVV